MRTLKAILKEAEKVDNIDKLSKLSDEIKENKKSYPLSKLKKANDRINKLAGEMGDRHSKELKEWWKKENEKEKIFAKGDKVQVFYPVNSKGECVVTCSWVNARYEEKTEHPTWPHKTNRGTFSNNEIRKK